MTDTTFKTKEETLDDILRKIAFQSTALDVLTKHYLREPSNKRRYTVQRAYRNLQSNLKKLETELALNQPLTGGIE